MFQRTAQRGFPDSFNLSLFQLQGQNRPFKDENRHLKDENCRKTAEPAPNNPKLALNPGGLQVSCFLNMLTHKQNPQKIPGHSRENVCFCVFVLRWFFSSTHPSRDVVFSGQNLAKKNQKLLLYMTSGSL